MAEGSFGNKFVFAVCRISQTLIFDLGANYCICSCILLACFVCSDVIKAALLNS